MMATASHYIGRFAPSPTGSLHAGSLVAALASWLDARAHHGQWLVRMEDVDQPRCIAGMDAVILNQLATLGMVSDASVIYQSQRTHLYEAALGQLQAQHLVYRCYCSRKEIGDSIYLGTCRKALWNNGDTGIWPAGQYATRLRVDAPLAPLSPSITWFDRRLGVQTQNVASDVGDFVVKRADGLFAYQLAVVVDDLAQGVTHIVRGEDLADNTALQIVLTNALKTPLQNAPQALLDKAYSRVYFQYLHVPLVLAQDGRKLSKQNGAAPLDLTNPMGELNKAAQYLGLHPQTGTLGDALMAWTRQWQTIWAR